MNIRVISAIALLCLVWGSLWGLVKHSLQVFPPFLFTSLRLILAAVTLMLLQLILKKSILPKRDEWKSLIILSALVCLGFYATQIFAMQFVDSGLSAVLVFTMPIFIGILAHYVLHERLNRQKVLGLILGTLGLIAILWPQLLHLSWNLSLAGELLLIGSISIMCIPVLSLCFGALIWHEPLTMNILRGAALICSGIVMSSLKLKSKNAQFNYCSKQSR